MGLDMYLGRKAYIPNYSHTNDDTKKLARAVLEALGLTGEQIESLNDGGIEVKLPIGYWRKANAIHAWFVKNVQDGVDECQESDVSKEQLEELKETCNKVLLIPDMAAELLPAQSGFFFGPTEYGDWYFESLRETVKIIDNALKLPEIGAYGDSFTYRASW